jgi:FecR protein
VKITVRTAIIVAVLAMIANCHASIGTITDQVNAPAAIQRSSKTLPGSKGATVEMDDAVKTTQGKVGITFADNTQVQINENSRLVIDDFVYDPKKPSAGKLALSMAAGTVRYASGAIAKDNPGRVSINTPTATIAVRGTDFSATVDELGASTIILLPSCPQNYRDVERDCKTGSIEVFTDVGSVVLNQAFQATKVESKGLAPLKPVILKLTEDAINNMLIVSPPRQLERNQTTTQTQMHNMSALDVDFLKETGLVNVLEKQQQELYQDQLGKNLLDQNFLANILDIIDAQLAAQQNLLNTSRSGLLPDYVAITGVVATVDDLTVNLYRDDGSNRQSVTVPKNQNTTVYQTQGSIEVKNRVNSGGNTVITVIQK